MNIMKRYHALRKEDPRAATKMAIILVLGGLVPVSLIVFSTAWAQLVKGLPKGPAMMGAAHDFASGYLWVYAASILIVAWMTLELHKSHPRLARRVAVGAAIGVLATFALDGLRLMGVVKGWLPMDTPVLFGTVILGPGSAPQNVYLVGMMYHLLNGASFGLVYALLWGRQPTTRAALQRGIGLLLVVELGMMTLPPMQPIVGWFGLDHAWPQLFLITLAAHVAFGAVLALMGQGLLPPEPQSPGPSQHAARAAPGVPEVDEG